MKYAFYIMIFFAGMLVGSHFTGCDRGQPCPETEPVKVTVDTATTIKKDSAVIHAPTLARETKRPAIKKVTPKPQLPVAMAPGEQTVEATDNPATDYAADCCNDYSLERVYVDTTRFNAGEVRVQSTVWQNRLINQIVWADIEQQTITKTITERIKPRGALYLGMDGQFMQGINVLAVGPSAMYISKRGRLYRGGALLGTNSQWIYQAGTAFKIGRK
jgi:hypothetical protein